MTLLPQAWLGWLHPADTEQAERFHRQLLLPETVCSDDETAQLVATSQMLRPGVAMSEAARARGLRGMLKALEVTHGREDAGSQDDAPRGREDLGAVTYVVDAAGGMLKLADVEPIDEARAQQAAVEVAALLAKAKARSAS